MPALQIYWLLPVSLSARRAWIEITRDSFSSSVTLVALRKESVDRNHLRRFHQQIVDVALRKESVDRNDFCYIIIYNTY